jgi:hypothetical protein
LLNLKELYLEEIEDLDILPNMPEVELVSLKFVSSFRFIPGLQSVKTLIVENCESLERIDFCPELEKANLMECFNLKDVSSCAHVQMLYLHIMKSLSSLKGIESYESSFIKDWRVVSILELPLLLDFSFCRFIYFLDLDSLPGLVSCEGISNIHTLKITDCDGLTSTKGLRKIFGKLELRQCEFLVSLLDVQNIPEVGICDCADLVDFSGLGQNRIVRIGDLETTLSFRMFQEVNPTILETIQQLVLKTS